VSAQRIAVEAEHGMVTSAHVLATEAGLEMLQRGGNAVDAAIAVQLVLGLVEPQSSGLGGGAFLLLHDGKGNRLIAYDGRETAPAAAKPDRFMKDGAPMAFHDAVVGGKSVGVPGTVRLLETVHKKHGRMPWAELFAPAIALAEQGFAVSPRLHALLAADRHITQVRAREYFFGADGKPVPVGTLLKNPAYAETLRRIATGGADSFYRGEIARDIVDTANSQGTNPGDLTLADLAGYRVQVRAAICDTYRGFRVCGVPLPSSGGVTVLLAVLVLIGCLVPALKAARVDPMTTLRAE